MFTAKKKTGKISDGISSSGSRGSARSERSATDQRSDQKPAGRASIVPAGRCAGAGSASVGRECRLIGFDGGLQCTHAASPSTSRC